MTFHVTVRGVSEETLDVLRREAEESGRSLTRHLVAVLDAAAERRRRREQLRHVGRRLEDVRGRLGAGTTDSAALLWAERGGR
ncbi:MAG TPA: hypothetical protein VFC93_02040 [Chloroflexota bacterium]|nr:hypothetical protein [Chloroflexota bacterium]